MIGKIKKEGRSLKVLRELMYSARNRRTLLHAEGVLAERQPGRSYAVSILQAGSEPRP